MSIEWSKAVLSQKEALSSLEKNYFLGSNITRMLQTTHKAGGDAPKI